MIKFLDGENGYTLRLGDKSLKFLKDRSYFSLGKADTDFRMTRGSFIYNRKVTENIPLYLGAAQVSENKVRFTLCDKKNRVIAGVCFEFTGDIVKIHPELKNRDFNYMTFSIPARESEHIYGCGENFTKFDLRGEKVRIWVAEHQNALRIAKKIVRKKLKVQSDKKSGKFSSYETYYAQPTFVSSRKYFVHADSSAYMEFDFRKGDMHTLRIFDVADIYIGTGSDFTQLSRLLTSFLGRQPALPDWVHDGIILGIQGGTEKVDEKLEKIISAGGKVCAVWCQDWCGARITGFGKQVMWNWEWDRDWYKGLDRKIPEWNSRGVHFLGYINPFMAIEKDLYKYAASKGYCVKDKNGKDYLVKITTFPAAMIDLTNPDAYEWIKSVIKENMIKLGLSGWMADFGEYLPTDCVLFSGENPKKIHNKWACLWAKVNREAVEETGNLGKIFFFTRAGYTDTIKHSLMMWNGDQHVDFSVDDGLASVIPASLSLSVSGFGLTHSDVGGYTTVMDMTRDEELLIRWAGMNAFSPLMRSHEGNQPDRNVQFDSNDTIIKHISKFSQIHAHIKPYIKECERQATEEGIPMIRPLFWHYCSERDFTEAYEYLLGADVLVAPVTERGALTRQVWLPEDEWIHVWTGESFSGGCNVVVDAPFDKPPVFIRKNSQYVELFDFR